MAYKPLKADEFHRQIAKLYDVPLHLLSGPQDPELFATIHTPTPVYAGQGPWNYEGRTDFASRFGIALLASPWTTLYARPES